MSPQGGPDIDSIGDPFVIHLGVDEVLLARFEADARARGMSVIKLDLAGLPDDEALCAYLASAFLYPFETKGLDAAVSLISDLEWFGNDGGYLVLVRGLPDSSPIAGSFVSLLPSIVDRWRSGTQPFVVAVDGKGPRMEAALRAANDRKDEFGRLPGVRPGIRAVDVVVHPTGPGPGD